MARWIYTFDALHPSGAKHWTVGLLQAKMKTLHGNGHEVKLARAVLAGEVVTNPLIIGKGWCRYDREDCLVYAGKPSRDLRGQNIETPPPNNMFLLVFVLPDGTIDDWAWRPASEQDPDVPSDITGDILWRKS